MNDLDYHDGYRFGREAAIKELCDLWFSSPTSPPPTNYDRLISKSPEEMAKFISHIAGCPLNVFEDSPMGTCIKNCRARDCWLEWLSKESE